MSHVKNYILNPRPTRSTSANWMFIFLKWVFIYTVIVGVYTIMTCIRSNKNEN